MIQLVEGDVAPTLSEWGVIVMALLVLTAGTLIWVWRRPGFADARTSRR